MLRTLPIYKVHRHHIKPPTLKIQTNYPFELLAINVMSLPKTSRGNVAVVVSIDHCSKWLNVVPIRNKTASTITNVLKTNILPNLPRLPTKILSDNGPEFRSSHFNEFLEEYNIIQLNKQQNTPCLLPRLPPCSTR